MSEANSSDGSTSEWDDLHLVRALVHDLQHCGGTLANAARDVLAERQRQVEVEGWTPEHDDEHSNGELADAAACYAATATAYRMRDHSVLYTRLWPWDLKWWKAKRGNRRRSLVKAGALILAEIERLDRLPPPPEQDQ